MESRIARAIALTSNPVALRDTWLNLMKASGMTRD
jgi:hypothetical protein